MGGVVQIVCTAEPEKIDNFIREIVARRPPMARISDVERKTINTAVFHEFSIAHSSSEEDEIAIVPADIAVCEDCLREFYDPGNPRYKHPFISCTNCGPRFSILERLPYDRDTTTMEDFPMCGFCEGEYTDPASRRYHAQTISCHDCGPMPLLGSEEGREFASQIANTQSLPLAHRKTRSDDNRCCIAVAAEALAGGGVVAIKGVGGYYLACTPFDEEAVQRLREIKKREQKPFAVMFRDAAQVKEYCVVGPREEAALRSPERPILLLEQRPDAKRQRGLDAEAAPEAPAEQPADATAVTVTAFPGEEASETASCEAVVFRPLAPGVCNTSRFVGAFLPSFGLQYLLLDIAGPLIMTSANISELPLITEDKEMADMAFSRGSASRSSSLFTEDEEPAATATREPFISGILWNKRRIAAGLDDSVARVVDGEVQIIRRSKGYVPTPVYVQAAGGLTKDAQIFAAGGHLKAALAFSKGAYSYLSRHIGDLESMEAEQTYGETFERMKAFFDVSPQLAVCDLHPRYYPTRFAESLRLPLIRVQHHHAHIASVMAEHGLCGPVIGVSFDGTGYGTDGAIWGGEILLCEGAAFERFSHLKYIDMVGGDASMKDAWKSAVSYIASLEGDARESKSICADKSKTKKASPHLDERTKETKSFAADPGEFIVDTGPLTVYCKEKETLYEARLSKEYDAARAAIKAGVNTVRTSSMGRLFDAACAMLGIHFENRYEGECAIMLENAAQRALTKARFGDEPTEQERLALYFHLEAARAVLGQCRLARDEKGIQKVCLSGGVFQNKILMEETLRLLRGDCFTVYYNVHVPPNDGGLALGQNYIGMLSLYRN